MHNLLKIDDWTRWITVGFFAVLFVLIAIGAVWGWVDSWQRRHGHVPEFVQSSHVEMVDAPYDWAAETFVDWDHVPESWVQAWQ